MIVAIFITIKVPPSTKNAKIWSYPEEKVQNLEAQNDLFHLFSRHILCKAYESYEKRIFCSTLPSKVDPYYITILFQIWILFHIASFSFPNGHYYCIQTVSEHINSIIILIIFFVVNKNNSYEALHDDCQARVY